MLAFHRALEHRTRAFVALLIATIAALTLAACGGGDDGDRGDAADARTILRETFSGTHEVRSGDARLSLALSERGGGDAFTLRIGGPFENMGRDEVPKFDFELDVDLGSQGGQFRAGVVSTSDRLFVKWDGDAYEVPSQLLDEARRSMREQADEAREDDSLTAFGIDPQTWVDDPEVVGREEIGGAETDHVSGTLNVPAFLDSIDRLLEEIDKRGLDDASGQDVPDRIPADDRAEIERTIRNARFDLWSGTEDRTLRKLQVRLDIDGGDDQRGGTVDFVIQIDGINEAQRIAAPSGAKPIDQLLGQFGGLLGGASLGEGPSGEDLSEYQDCLMRAGGDIDEAQRCAALLR